MEFSYNQGTKKYKLGDTEYTQEEFITYIKAGMLATALSIQGSFEVEKRDDNTLAPNNFTPTQLILYGVPGSGKSYKIARHLEELGITKENASEYTKRVVFHPEYTNSDFIGQILPRSDASGNTISYPFVAGPFTARSCVKGPATKG